MIKMVYIQGRHCPKMFCDFCDKVIEKSGNVTWKQDLDKPGKATAVLFAHKGCDKTWTDDGEFYLWQELDAFFIYLLNNSKINYKKARQKAKYFSDF